MAYSPTKDRASEVLAGAGRAADSAKRDATELQDTITRGAADLAENVSTRLKSVGVNTDVMVDKAREHMSELQRLIADELATRPTRSLGIAAAIGFFAALILTPRR